MSAFSEVVAVLHYCLRWWSRLPKSVLVVLICAGALAAQSSASEREIIRFEPFFFDRSDPTTIFLVGDIDVRAGLNFARIVDASGEAKNLVLASDGGLVHVALSIALEVRRQQLTTFVPSGSRCYSACSFLWFAGVNRHADGEIGVHQLASTTADLAAGQVAIGDIVDVLAGFDVPSDVIVRMLQTPATEIYVLSRDELRRFSLVEGGDEVALPASPPRSETRQASIEERAIGFVAQNNRDWSISNEQALERIRSQYAALVDFYGNNWSRDRVIQEKRQFADRWPVRDYHLDMSTASAHCDSSTCVVSGEVVWDARSPSRNAISRGRSHVEITLEILRTGFLILGENGSVIARY